MANSSPVRRRVSRWIAVVSCILFITPLTGCSEGFLGYAAVSSVYYSFIGFMPLRAVIGGAIRDAFVGAF
jgi:hypothetical protein